MIHTVKKNNKCCVFHFFHIITLLVSLVLLQISTPLIFLSENQIF